MNLNHLLVFYHVAKHKNFSRAAEALFVSQPSVSSQVKLLEDAYGFKLFERFGKRNIELTNSGQVLYSYAEQVFSLIKKADRAMEEFNRVEYGRIKINTASTLGTYYLPVIINHFQKKHPKIDIQMDIGYDRDTVNHVMTFQCDLGLMGRPICHPNIMVIPLWKEKLVFIVHPKHSLARFDSIDISQLQDQPFVSSEKGAGIRNILEDLLAKKGLSPHIVMELGDNEAIKQAVASKVGIAIISAKVAKRELDVGILRAVRLSDAEIMRQFFIIYHKDKYISHPIRAFLDEILHFDVNKNTILPKKKSC